jgi:hypothetical protein
MPGPDDGNPGSGQGDDQGGSGTHTEHEHFPWTRRIPDHPPRQSSKAYVASRRLMNKLARSVTDFFYGATPYEDHHGGGLWLKDADGWFVVRNIAGVEWSAQFCADPAKVDVLRQNARRLYDRFPEAVQALGIRTLLDTPIRTADDVARWTDSICNASVPLPEHTHRGVLPAGGGIHHYPTPVAEIALFKYDDFPLWVTDQDGNEIAVAPVASRGQGGGRVQVLDAPAGSPTSTSKPATLSAPSTCSTRQSAGTPTTRSSTSRSCASRPNSARWKRFAAYTGGSRCVWATSMTTPPSQPGNSATSSSAQPSSHPPYPDDLRGGAGRRRNGSSPWVACTLCLPVRHADGAIDEPQRASPFSGTLEPR